MAVQEEDEMRGRGQQPVLASQREKAQSQEGRVAKWFPLSAKEGFSQWVSGAWGGEGPGMDTC